MIGNLMHNGNTQYQTTIAGAVSCYDIGVHSGQKIQMTLKPNHSNSGVVFVRTDVSGHDNVILANYKNVTETTLSTSISNSAGASVATIEHLMSALAGTGIDNIIVELDGPEVPIMDGSSKLFLFMIECAGKIILPYKKKHVMIRQEVSVSDNGSEITIAPHDKNHLTIDLTIDFPSPAIGMQKILFDHNSEVFSSQIASARTFGFVRDLEYLQSRGLARGASLENAIGIENDKIINSEGLRFQDEFVRHKALDLIGDVYTSGGVVIGYLSGYKTSHQLNNMLLRKIFENPNSYEIV
jgi:UDP-3-O-[3-hydroxymyristoyl] N-acetylglucosamine deacetylase